MNSRASGQSDVVVVGGGAAGLSAALFLQRAALSVLVVDQDRSILKRALLNNLPAAGGIEGAEFLATLRDQMDPEYVTQLDAKAVDIAATSDLFEVSLSNETSHTCRYVVLATGQGTLKIPSLPLERAEPRQPFVKVNVVTDRWGETTVPNVWACGVVAGWPSQAVVCAGSGAAVAVELISRERGEFWVDHDDTRLGASEE